MEDFCSQKKANEMDGFILDKNTPGASAHKNFWL